MNLRDAVEALTQQYMRENDWPVRRARRKALAVVRRKMRGVVLPPAHVLVRRVARREMAWRTLRIAVATVERIAWVVLGMGLGRWL